MHRRLRHHPAKGLPLSTPQQRLVSSLPINPHPLSYDLSASTGQSQQATSGSQRTGRTTGFNSNTGEGMLTEVCGVVSPAKGGKPKASRGRQGSYRCPRCNGRFTRPRSVKDHFISCVRKYGNPSGLKWFDHRSLAGSRDWHLNHVPAVKAEEDEGDEGDEERDEERDEEEGDEEERDEEAEEGGEVEGTEEVDEGDDQGEEVEDMQWE